MSSLLPLAPSSRQNMIISAELIIQPNMPPVAQGAIVIKNGMIQAVGPANKIIKKYSSHRTYTLDNAVLIPGLVNLHTHLELPPLLDLIRADTFSDWVLNLINVKKHLVIKDYKLAARQNINAIIRSGTTTIGEICTHNISSSLLKESGVRATIFDEIINMGSGARGQGPGIKKRKQNNGLIRNGLSPHTPYTVSEAILRSLKNAPLAMHVAESKDELKLLQGRKSGLEQLYRFAKWDLAWAPKGNSSFEYLKRINLLSSNLLAVHAVRVTDSDIKLIKKSKTSIAHCPRSNKELGVGRMPLKKMLDAGVTVGLGTDSLASVSTLNMWDEMRYAYKIHKNGITAKDIFELATIGGAKALGMDKEIGTLEVGKKADFIAVPLPKRNTGDIYSDLLRETNSCIMSVVNGKNIFQK